MATASTQAALRRTYLVSFDPKSKQAVQLMSALKLMDFLSIEESPYDPRYVADIKTMEKRTFKTISRSNLYIY